MVLGNLSHLRHHGFHLQDYHLLWWAAPDPSVIRIPGTSPRHRTPERPHNFPAATHVGLTPPEFGLLPVRSPLLGQSHVDFFYLRVLRCFTSPRVASATYGFSVRSHQMNDEGLPHSEISGSTPACGSPKLIAACHVLHRRSKPRHPPSALRSLTTRELLGETMQLSKSKFCSFSDVFHFRCSIETLLCRSFTAHESQNGPERDRTADLLNANQALSQLSYRPKRVTSKKRSSGPYAKNNLYQFSKMVGRTGIAPVTPALSARCSAN